MLLVTLALISSGPNPICCETVLTPHIATVRTSNPGTEELRQKEIRSLLRDFRTDSRMLVLVALSVPVGALAAVVAKALLWLIAELTNLVFFPRFGPMLPPLQNHHLGPWVIVAPVAGALVIGLMARYGYER